MVQNLDPNESTKKFSAMLASSIRPFYFKAFFGKCCNLFLAFPKKCWKLKVNIINELDVKVLLPHAKFYVSARSNIRLSYQHPMG